MSSANDTLGYFISETGVGFPSNIDLLSYTAPSTLLSQDGEIELFTSNTGSQAGFSLNGDPNIRTEFNSLAAGIVKGVYHKGPNQKSNFSFIMGNPEDWVNINSGDMTCPIGVNLASDVGTCDREAYINGVQNGSRPYTYDWNDNNIFVSDTIVTGLCVDKQSVVIKDQNGFLKTCEFVMGSSDIGYFPPVQTSDTAIHTFIDYCIDPTTDFISLLGSEIIDSLTISLIWSFYSGSKLIDQLLDTVILSSSDPIYSNAELHASFICDSTKSLISVYSTYGNFTLPFTETGKLNLNDFSKGLDFSTYPNPVSDYLNISLNDIEVKEVVILNAMGQEIKPVFNSVSKNHLIIDFSHLSKGNYMIKLITKDNVVLSKKLIKD